MAALWPACYGTLQGYRIGTAGGFAQEPNQFPFGLAMNYMRTGILPTRTLSISWPLTQDTSIGLAEAFTPKAFG